MSLGSPSGYERLRPADAALVDAICDRFESDWKRVSTAGEPPEIQPYLAGQPESVHSVLARELIALDRAYRERRGETLTAERYLNLLSERDLAGVGQGPSQGGHWPDLPGLQIVKVLGAGGMGVVYKAWQPELNRYVAVKMLRHADLAGAEHRERFAREARAVAQLQHPQMVQIYAIGEMPGTDGDPPLPYFMMEYVAGGNLAEALRGQPQPPRAAAQLLETLARALHYAHQQRIIHRDLKPGNILVQRNRGDKEKETGPPDSPPLACIQPKITDFGLARLGIGSDLTRTGDTLGTPSYMAPEQTDGKSLEVSPLTDVYGLGAIFYEMLTGRPPFQAETALATILQVRQEEPISLRRLQPTVPVELETICLKCLQKVPQQRYSSAEALADDLHRYLEGRPILARPTSIGQRTLKWIRRHPAAAGLAAVSSLGTAVLLAILLISNMQIRQQQRETQVALDAERLTLYFHRIRLAQAALQGNNPRQAEAFLQACRPIGDERDLRGWEWHHLLRQCHAELISWGGKEVDVREVAFLEGGRVASLGTDGVLKVWDLAAGQFVSSKSIFPPTKQLDASFSPDGKSLGNQSERTLKIYAVEDGRELHTFRSSQPVFSADGSRLALIDKRQNKAWFFDIPAGKIIRSCSLPSMLDIAYAFQADGLWQAVVCPDQTLRVWNVETGKDKFVLQVPFSGGLSPYFSPDGQWLAAAGSEGIIKIWDATRGELRTTFRAHPGNISCLAFSVDNKQLASGSSSGALKVWDLQGNEIRTLPGHGVMVNRIAFSPDGRMLASIGADHAVKIWDIQKDVQAVVLRHPKKIVVSVGFSPDGQRLVTASSDQTVKIWDTTTGKVSLDVPGGMASICHAEFTKDGERIRAWGGTAARREWDSATAKEVQFRQGFREGNSNSILVSPGGTFVASIKEGNRILLHDPATGEVQRELRGHTGRISMMTCSLNDRFLVVASHDNSIKVWETATGRECCTYRGHADRIRCLTISADGLRIASGGFDKMIRLWDSQTGEELQTFENPWGRLVESVAFSPDGRRLASGSFHGTVSLWDTESGQEVLELPSGHAIVTMVTFSPEGRRLAAVCLDGTVRVWDGPSPASEGNDHRKR